MNTETVISGALGPGLLQKQHTHSLWGYHAIIAELRKGWWSPMLQALSCVCCRSP